MVKHILLKCDKEMYYKLKLDKQMREIELDEILTWEKYIELLFGLKLMKGGNK